MSRTTAVSTTSSCLAMWVLGLCFCMQSIQLRGYKLLWNAVQTCWHQNLSLLPGLLVRPVWFFYTAALLCISS